jgi:hypothetical protein
MNIMMMMMMLLPLLLLLLMNNLFEHALFQTLTTARRLV